MASRVPKLLVASRGTLLDSWTHRRGSALDAHRAVWSRVAAATMDLVARRWEQAEPFTAETLAMTPGTPCRIVRDGCTELVDHGVEPTVMAAELGDVFQVIEGFLLGLDAAPRQQLARLRRLADMRNVVTVWILELFGARRTAGVPPGPFPMREAVGRFDQLYAATTDLILLTDGEGMVRDANPEARVRFGELLLGRPLAEILAPPQTDLAVLTDGTDGAAVHEIRVELGGHPRHFGLRVLPRADSAGHMVLLNDITCLVDQRESLESEVARRTADLARSEAMLESILESAGEGVLVVDEDLEIARANQQASEILGLPWAGLLGLPLHDLVAYSERRSLQALIRDLQPGEVRQAELTGVYVDGREFPAAFTVNRFDHDGRRWLGVLMRDITGQKQLEQRLRDERQQSEEMNVTLRNVLNTIESEREEAERRLAARIRDTILPALDKAQGQGRAEIRTSYLNLVRSQLVDLTEGSSEPLDEELLRLSRTELEICRLVRSGAGSKAIGEALSLSVATVQTHRKNIRRKLGLQGRGVNLHNFLQTKRALGQAGD